MPPQADLIRAAEVVLPCSDLTATLDFFTERLGFQIASIYPADNPAVAVVTGHGTRLRFETSANALGSSSAAVRSPAGMSPAVNSTLRLTVDAMSDRCEIIEAPDGLRIECVPSESPVVVPPLEAQLTITTIDNPDWVVGRAGMRYRDLIPGRLGGRYAASHIQIRQDGPVPDYVHYHRVRFQIIYCWRGRVRVVYEDQGQPFDLQPGDCILQPPGIRHRVLDSDGQLDVIELACPAEHETLADHGCDLPTGINCPERLFDGQQFVHSQASTAGFEPYSIDGQEVEGYEARDLGIASASNEEVDVRIVRRTVTGVNARMRTRTTELTFYCVLTGTALFVDATPTDRPVRPGDAITVPAGTSHAWADPSDDFEWLEVTAVSDPQ